MCLNIELPDGGQFQKVLYPVLAEHKRRLKKALRPLKMPHPTVSCSKQNGTETTHWTVDRDPKTRHKHWDR